MTSVKTEEVVWVTEWERGKLVREVGDLRYRCLRLWMSCGEAGMEIDWAMFEVICDELELVEKEVLKDE